MHKMKKYDDYEIPEIIYESLEKNFPKGKCKERGNALVLVAEIMSWIKERDKWLYNINNLKPKIWGRTYN